MAKHIVGRGRRKLINSVNKLKKSTVKVGFFKDQGQHKSGFSYPALMYLHEVHGIKASNGLVYRRAFETAMQLHGASILTQTKKSLKGVFSGGGSVDKVFTTFGESAKHSIKDVFGNPALLTPNTPSTIKSKGGRNTPLVDTSELVDKLTYRVTEKSEGNK